MGNKGTQLEKTVRLIQEAFKDSENTQIYSNYKIPNESGNNREIDIFIVSKVNDFEINIAIECKDYNKKVPVEKIEAFQSKCDRIKQINKKIFISSKGYQSDAINSAKYYGIELLTAEEINDSTFKNIIPIRQLKPEILPIINNAVLNFDATEETLVKIRETFQGEVFNKDDDSIANITKVILEAIEKYKREIFALALIEWMKIKHESDDEKTFPVNFGLTFHKYYIKGDNNEKITLLDGNFDVLVKFGFISPQLTGRTLKDSQGITKANSVDIKMADNLESHMIIKNNNEVDFYVTENEEVKKLQTLFTYNPKTNKITKPK
jgi:hypothetical protein